MLPAGQAVSTTQFDDYKRSRDSAGWATPLNGCNCCCCFETEWPKGKRGSLGGLPGPSGEERKRVLLDSGSGKHVVIAVRDVHQIDDLFAGVHLDVEVPPAARPATQVCRTRSVGVQRGDGEGLAVSTRGASGTGTGQST